MRLLPELLNALKLLGIGSRPVWDGASDSWQIPDNAAVADVDPARLPFFDLLHPSTATHGVLGAFAAESLTSQVRLLGRGDDFVFGASRDDLVLSGADDDTIRAGAGGDVVLAGLGDDRAAGGAGDDILAGGLGDDRLAGGEGCDVLAGSDGDDLQRGGDGRDALIDGLGHDRLGGGGGRDAFLYVEAAALGGGNALDGGNFRGGAGVDTLYMVLSDATRGAVEGALTAGASAQSIAAIDVTTASIERYVFLDSADGVDAIVTGARIGEADAWGFV